MFNQQNKMSKDLKDVTEALVWTDGVSEAGHDRE
jgi:hypothetical protein